MLAKDLLLLLAASIAGVNASVSPPHWEAHCITGTSLDPADTDSAHGDFRSWAGGYPTISTTDHNEAEIFRKNNMFWYACTDKHNDHNQFSAADLDDAARAVDKACPRYTSSWAIYVTKSVCAIGFPNCDGGDRTSKIIGKAREGEPVCQGQNGA